MDDADILSTLHTLYSMTFTAIGELYVLSLPCVGSIEGHYGLVMLPPSAFSQGVTTSRLLLPPLSCFSHGKGLEKKSLIPAGPSDKQHSNFDCLGAIAC